MLINLRERFLDWGEGGGMVSINLIHITLCIDHRQSKVCTGKAG